ncbi:MULTISPECIES: PepSY domain-containing protein [unclassified Streptomyces]|uniref:PepSY domain-containing protein n=1 Tax=unclassified Streptomyces TaxID=2593676 RepID=UPI002E13F307|nr:MULTISPECIES: PepSY domain-containing protein [unclassified Streptomyces]WSR28219.1 PepSY domain-containing protein [Streptomyces sp. NBC_01205]
MHCKHKAYVSTAAAALLLVGGPAAAAVAHPADAARKAPAAAPARADTDAAGAVAAALKKYPGVVESVDKDDAVWHVDIIGKNGKHAELTVDTRSGKVFTENANDDDGDDNGGNKALVGAKVTAQQAMKAALAAHAGQVRSVEWDDDDDSGKRYWNVEITSGGKTTNVHVDPTSGKATVSGSDSNDDG